MGLSRSGFLKALQAEGIPASSGYRPLNKMPYIADGLSTKNYKKMYPPELLDYNNYMEQNQCPVNDQLCEEAVWLFHSMLLTEKSDMDDIANSIEKINRNADKLKKV